jgi:hypothetical protein
MRRINMNKYYYPKARNYLTPMKSGKYSKASWPVSFQDLS